MKFDLVDKMEQFKPAEAEALETSSTHGYSRLRRFVVSIMCVALGFFVGRESVRMNWLKSNVAQPVKPTPQVIIISPDKVDPPPSGNPFDLIPRKNKTAPEPPPFPE